jgi:hypothetical protein
VELMERLDNRIDKLRKANRKISRMGRKVTIQALGLQDDKEEGTPV